MKQIESILKYNFSLYKRIYNISFEKLKITLKFKKKITFCITVNINLIFSFSQRNPHSFDNNINEILIIY